MAAIRTEEQVSLKLVLNKDKTEVVFAEAEKEFVDALFSLLTLPLGTIARLVGKKELETKPVRVGCLNSLYECVAKIEERCFSTETCKEMLLQPRNSAEACCRSMKLNIDDTEPTKYFLCQDESCRLNNYSMSSSTFENKPCGKCRKPLDYRAYLQECQTGNEGFVSSNATFIITNDMRIMPMCGASIALLKDFGIDDIRSVHNGAVNVTKDKVIDLLKGFLLSSDLTLTRLFLERKALPISRPILLSRSQCAANDRRQINVKLIRRKSNGRIVFAQGQEDFANFILSFLTFPLGGAIRMLEGSSSVGSFGRLHKSIVNLDENYFISKEAKDMLVDSRVALHFHLKNQLLPICESQAPKYCFHGFCRSQPCNLLSFKRCSVGINDRRCKSLNMVDPKSSIGEHDGFVKGPAMYMVTDELVVARISSLSGMSLFSGLGIPLSDLEEKSVSIGIKEGLSILKASLTSAAALTNGLGHLLGSS